MSSFCFEQHPMFKKLMLCYGDNHKVQGPNLGLRSRICALIFGDIWSFRFWIVLMWFTIFFLPYFKFILWWLYFSYIYLFWELKDLLILFKFIVCILGNHTWLCLGLPSSSAHSINQDSFQWSTFSWLWTPRVAMESPFLSLAF